MTMLYSDFNPDFDPRYMPFGAPPVAPVDPAQAAAPAPQAPMSMAARFGNAAKGFLGNRDLALALLANSGGPVRQSFGQILGQSGLQAQAMGQQRQDDALKRQYMMAQMAAMGQRGQQKPIAVIGPDGKPILVNESDAIGKQPYAGGNDAKPSALLQAYNTAREQGFTGTLLDFQRELSKATAQYPYKVTDVGGVPTKVPVINPSPPSIPQPAGMVQPTLAPQPLSTLSTEATAKRDLANAGAAGAATGTKTAEATFDLPRVEQNVNQAIGDIQKLKNHPGLKYITGIYSKAPIVPGTPQAAADAAAKQVQGQTFLQAYQQLRGSGAITEVEGAKGEAAVGRLIRSQSTEDYQKALDDLTDVLKNGLERARKQTGTSQNKDPLGIR